MVSEKQKRKKVLITATVLSHIGQFHRPLAEMLYAEGYEVHVAGKDNLALKNGLKIDWADKVFDVPFARSPRSTDNIRAYKVLKRIIDEGGYDFVHCNTPMGGIVTRLAARGARRRGTKVVYTAHGFHFYRGASRLAWMVYYPIERFFCRYTDKLVTINREDAALAWERFRVEVHYTHGVGVDASRYVPVSGDAEDLALRRELGIAQGREVLLCVGELLPNKNQRMAIDAVDIVRRRHPEVLLVLAGNGPEKDVLEAEIAGRGLGDNVRMIGYCAFLEKYQKVACLLVACSHREGLPLNLVEAMLAGNPVVAGRNRGHCELVSDGVTGFLVGRDDSAAMAGRIETLLDDGDLRRRMGSEARRFALQYGFDEVKEELRHVYFG